MKKGILFHRFNLFANLFSVLLYLLSSAVNTMAAAWGLSYITIGTLNFIGAVAYVFSTLYMGHKGDRFGFKKILYPLMLGFSIFLITGFFWSSPWQLFIFVVGMNLFFGTFFPLVEGLISSQEKREGIDHVATTVRFTLSWSMGNIFGMAFGPYLIQKLPASVFVFGIVLCISASILTFLHLRKHGDSIPGPYHPILMRHTEEIDFPRIKLYRKAYRFSFVLGGIVYSAVLALFPKLIAVSDIPLYMTGFLVVGGNIGAFVTFALLGFFRGWVGKPKLSFILLMIFPITTLALFLKPSPFIFIFIAFLAGMNYGIPYTFAIFYGLNSQEQDHGKQGGLHEAMVGIIFGLGPVFGGIALDLWQDLRSLGILSLGLCVISIINQLIFLKRVKSPQIF